MMIKRDALETLRELAGDYPAVIVTGPRQSGKTTLAVTAFPGKVYVSLENLDVRAHANEDPRGFLSRYPDGAILDEVQHAPDLLSYMQELIDFGSSARNWVLTGSQRFGVLSGFTQSLAGRAAYLELLPFSLNELSGRLPGLSLDSVLLSGLYPPVHDRKLDPGIWSQNYIRSHLERDVREAVNVRDLSSFRKFLKLAAARTGQLLNLSNLACETGITHNTAKHWLSVLEAGYIVFLLYPHHRNFSKRIVKTPKLYFHDTGLASSLLSIDTEASMNLSPMRGNLFENLVVSEFLKSRLNRGMRENAFFWRDNTGHEIDVLIETSGRLLPVEIKSGATVTTAMFKGLDWWSRLSGNEGAFLVYGGDASFRRESTEVLSWRSISMIETMLRSASEAE
jgi:uncharacterized protein